VAVVEDIAMIIWRRKDTEFSGAEVAEVGHFGLVLARISLRQAADFEAAFADFSEFFSPSDLLRWSEFKPGPRRTAFLAARLALTEVLIGTSLGIRDLSYDGERPVLPRGYLSLSHGGDWAVAAYHPLLPVGIDVEAPRAQLKRVIARVASAREVAELDHATVWGAKEAVYKAAGIKGLDWKKEIEVRSTRTAMCTRSHEGYALEAFQMDQDHVVVAVRKPLRVVLTGPESAGKTRLAAQLAREFGTLWTPEIAREYLGEHGAHYTPEDVVEMGRLQAARAEGVATCCPEVVIEDTDLLTHRIWFREKYGHPHPDLEAMPLKGDLYLLCAPDLAWTHDPLREHPKESDRQRHFELYKTELEVNKKIYAVVSGQGSARKMNALRTLEAFEVLLLAKHRGAGDEIRLR
jgi:nicotinamide riboside kinase/phosphopantetheinyl transferase